jgi:hypothetical protein
MTTSVDWPAGLDAVVAAPDHHRVLLENAEVRVLDTRIGPGERTPVRTHQWPAVHNVLAWTDFVRRDADGIILLDTRAGGAAAAPPARWGSPLGPHSLENVGRGPLHIVSVELKALQHSVRHAPSPPDGTRVETEQNGDG